MSKEHFMSLKNTLHVTVMSFLLGFIHSDKANCVTG